jgi:hypothetical protein
LIIMAANQRFARGFYARTVEMNSHIYPFGRNNLADNQL